MKLFGKGFTMIELMIVIVIMAILSIYLVPKLFNITSFASDAHVEETVNLIRHAQKLAISSGCHIGVHYSASSKKQWFSSRQYCTNGDFEIINNNPSLISKAVKITSGAEFFYFDQSGRIYNKSSSMFNPVFEFNNTSKKIQVIGQTGLVYVLSS